MKVPSTDCDKNERLKRLKQSLLGMLISAAAISGPSVSRLSVPSNKSERENMCRDLVLGEWVGTGSKS